MLGVAVKQPNGLLLTDLCNQRFAEAIGPTLGERIDVSANRDNSNGIRVDLAENRAKSADATGISQAASALVNDGSVRNNGTDLIFDLFDCRL